MIYDVYVDLFFLINFSMDYICLYISAKILRHKIRTKKLVISSAIGGLYAVASLFIITEPILAFIIDALVCLIMIAICFYSKGEKLKYIFVSTLLYVGVSMLLGGIMTALFNLLNKLDIDLGGIADDGAHTYIFAIIAIISAAISMKGISLITRKNKHREYYVNITLKGKSCPLLGFVDTGNLIKEQISGKGIIFIDKAAAAKVIPTDTEKKYYDGEIVFPGSRLVPIVTAQGSSLILVIPPDKVTIKEKSQKNDQELAVDCLLGLTSIDGKEYSAIIPDDIRRLL